MTGQSPLGQRAGRFALPAVLAGLLLTASGASQQIQFDDRPVQPRKGHVQLLTDSVEVAAGSPQDVELRFRVDVGFHINSHTPKDELLLPTALKLDAAPAVRVAGEQYPAGTPFHPQFSEGEALDVYQDEFRVRLRLLAQRGVTTLSGALRYQACDSQACFPPRTLPVKVLVTAK